MKRVEILRPTLPLLFGSKLGGPHERSRILNGKSNGRRLYYINKEVIAGYWGFLRKEQPSVRRALPPVGWQRTVLQAEQITTYTSILSGFGKIKENRLKHTVWACEKTVVMFTQPGHLTSMKYELGDWTRRFSLCLRFSSARLGCSRSCSNRMGVGCETRTAAILYLIEPKSSGAGGKERKDPAREAGNLTMAESATLLGTAYVMLRHTRHRVFARSLQTIRAYFSCIRKLRDTNITLDCETSRLTICPFSSNFVLRLRRSCNWSAPFILSSSAVMGFSMSIRVFGISSAIFATLAVITSLFLIVNHVRYYTLPNHQRYEFILFYFVKRLYYLANCFHRYIIRILTMVPVYAIYSALSIFLYKYHVYFALLRDRYMHSFSFFVFLSHILCLSSYEAYVMYQFFVLCLNYGGGFENLSTRIASQSSIPLAFPFQFIRAQPGRYNYLFHSWINRTTKLRKRLTSVSSSDLHLFVFCNTFFF